MGVNQHTSMRRGFQGSRVRRSLLIFAFVVSCQAQVRVLATPEPMVVLQALRVRDLGLWNLSVCNDSATPVVLQHERLVLALPSLRIISSVRAQAVLAHARSRTPRATAARIIRYAPIVATAAAGLSQVPARAVGIMAVGAIAADQIASRLEASTPLLEPLLRGTTDTALELGPGQCGSRTVFAAIQQSVKPIEVEIHP